MAQVAINMTEIKIGDTLELIFSAPMSAPHYGKSVETVTVETITEEPNDLFPMMSAFMINGRDVMLHSGLIIAERA